MEKLILNNGKEITINIDYGNGLPYKPLLIPALEYGDWDEDNSITIIRIDLDKEEFHSLTDKNLKFNELHFIDDQFWFDFDTFYLVIHNNDFIYNHIYHKKFTIILNDNNEKEIKTLNFIKD